MAAKDMAGMRFGRLVVIGHRGCKGRRSRWLCRCDCGREKIVSGSSLRGSETKSCGCLRRELAAGINQPHDHTGKRFGMLTVVRPAPKGESQQPRWECLCDCGNTTVVRAGNLRNGNISSCGCLIRRKGSDNPAWRGGRQVSPDGYVTITVLEDGEWRRVKEHRYVMEKHLGRRLLKNENVHHLNGDRADNRPENLELWVKVQPCGQRVKDLVAFGADILRRYAPHLLREERLA